MTPPWAFMDGMGLAHRRAAGAGHTRPGGFSRGWAVTGGFRGVGDAAPYVGGCPLTGCRANLRRDTARRLLFFFQHWAGHTVENVSSLPGMDV